MQGESLSPRIFRGILNSVKWQTAKMSTFKTIKELKEETRVAPAKKDETRHHCHRAWARASCARPSWCARCRFQFPARNSGGSGDAEVDPIAGAGQGFNSPLGILVVQAMPK